MDINLILVYNDKISDIGMGGIYKMTLKREKTRKILLLVSGLLILVGGFRGEIHTVFMKAINICLECVGIG